MNLHRILLYLFPDYQRNDWLVQDDMDGKGPYIALWNRLEARPTNVEIATASTTADVAANKSIMWAKIKAERERRKFTGGFKVGTLWFHSDADSRSQYNTMLNTAIEQALLPTYEFRPAWKTMSGETTPMTVELVRQIRDAGFISEAAIFDNAEAHKAAMEASPDPLSYDFSTGWGTTYEESLVI